MRRICRGAAHRRVLTHLLEHDGELKGASQDPRGCSDCCGVRRFYQRLSSESLAQSDARSGTMWSAMRALEAGVSDTLVKVWR